MALTDQPSSAAILPLPTDDAAGGGGLRRAPRAARLAVVGAAAAWLLVGLGATIHGLDVRPEGLALGIADGPGLALELALLGILTWFAVSLRHRGSTPAVSAQVGPSEGSSASVGTRRSWGLEAQAAGTVLRGVLLGAVGVLVALVLITGGEASGLATSAFPDALVVAHWIFAAAVLPIALAAMWLARPAGRGTTGPAFELAVTGAALYVIELLVGAAGAFTTPEAWVAPVHLLLGAGVLACFVGAAAQVVTGSTLAPEPASAWTPSAPAGASRVRPASAGVRRPSPALATHSRFRAYVALTKPRIIELLLVTTVPAMVLAAPEVPGLQPGQWLLVVIWTLIGGTLAAGSANAINQYIDRDIDARMTRTRRRPLPDSALDPRQVLLFSLALGVLAFGLLLLTTNLLAAVLTLLANAFYVVVYTLLLKRTTVQNIVIGGAAGALPPMIGWAALTGGLAPAPILLFLIVFFWTPPHFWALALRLKDDYAAAGVPMLPVVRGVAETDRQILLYTIAVVGLTFLLVPVAGMGLLYLIAAAALGAYFLRQAAILWRDGTVAPAMRMYRGSITYLAGIFAAVALDVVVHIRL